MRCLDNYQEEFDRENLKIILSDSGEASKFQELKEIIQKKKYNLKLKFINFVLQKIMKIFIETIWKGKISIYKKN